MALQRTRRARCFIRPSTVCGHESHRAQWRHGEEEWVGGRTSSLFCRRTANYLITLRRVQRSAAHISRDACVWFAIRPYHHCYCLTNASKTHPLYFIVCVCTIYMYIQMYQHIIHMSLPLRCVAFGVAEAFVGVVCDVGMRCLWFEHGSQKRYGNEQAKTQSRH